MKTTIYRVLESDERGRGGCQFVASFSKENEKGEVVMVGTIEIPVMSGGYFSRENEEILLKDLEVYAQY